MSPSKKVPPPSAEQLQQVLRHLVRLREHRDAGLQQDLLAGERRHLRRHVEVEQARSRRFGVLDRGAEVGGSELEPILVGADVRSEEHTSELQSLMRISYAVFCLKKQKQKATTRTRTIDK